MEQNSNGQATNPYSLVKELLPTDQKIETLPITNGIELGAGLTYEGGAIHTEQLVCLRLVFFITFEKFKSIYF